MASKKEDILTCCRCGKANPKTAYYMSFNTFAHLTGRIPFCKKCLVDMITDDDGQVNMKQLKKALRLMDKPFISDLWYKNLGKVTNPQTAFGLYIKDTQLMQHRQLTWDDSDQIDTNKNNPNSNVDYDLVIKWGEEFEQDDYIRMEKFYGEMLLANDIKTPQDVAYLKNIVMTDLRLKKALASGDVVQATKLGTLFSKLMGDSQFRAMDKTDADRTGGLRNFATIFAEVEKDEHIPPWEAFRKIKGIQQDIVDKTIMHILNYTNKLQKIEQMTAPPVDTPKLDEHEIDKENVLNVMDIEVDTSCDKTEGET